jgi:hypothetical protein
MNNLRNIMCALACAVLVSAISSTYAGDNDDGDRHHGVSRLLVLQSHTTITSTTEEER